MAFLSKFGWGLIHNHDGLWVQVLRSWYKCGSDLIPHIHRSQNSSNVWKGICASWHIVEHNLGLKLGDRQSISFWDARWVPHCASLHEIANHAVLSHLDNLKVMDVVSATTGWDWPFISSLIPITVVNRIASILPPSVSNGPDSLFWLPSNDGNFTVKIAYLDIAHHNLSLAEPIFKVIWHWHGLERLDCSFGLLLMRLFIQIFIDFLDFCPLLIFALAVMRIFQKP